VTALEQTLERCEDDDQAARVYTIAGRFLGDARALLRQLDERND
jgi:hypothetical protein